MMAGKKQPLRTCLHRSNNTAEFAHLRPLSVYSRSIIFNTTVAQAGDVFWCPTSPFCNIKVERVNSSASVGHKRQLDDSCLDETYETPLKKLCLAKCHSPDLSCVLDSSDALPDAKPVTPKSSSVVAHKIGCSSTRTNAPDERLPPLQGCAHLVWVDGSVGDRQTSPCTGDVQSNSPPGVNGEVEVNYGPAFDFVDEILCLSPIDHVEEPPSSLGDFIQSCQTFSEEQMQEVWRGGGGNGSCCRGQSSKQIPHKTEEYRGKDTPKQTNTERDDGYYTHYYKMAASKGANYRNPSKLQPSLTPVMSTPLASFRKLVRKSPIMKTELRLVKGGSSTEIPELLNNSVSLCGSIKLGACNTEAFHPFPFLENTSREGKIWSVGTSTCKSLGYHSGQQGTVTMAMASQVMEDGDVSVSEQKEMSRFQVAFSESSSADSFESTLPLQVQVKSKVVLPVSQKLEVHTEPAAAVCPSARLPPWQQPERQARSASQLQGRRDAKRPAVFDRDENWEREKQLYVDSVTRHIVDNTGVGDGVVTELLHLMSAVANQETGRDGSQWQHPSDLTRRNYQQRNSGRLLSLNQWQNLNHRGRHRRFAKVPAVFQRSPVL